MRRLNHYNDEYFSYQKKMGVFSAEIDLIKYQKHISEEDRILDYGCGAGFLLNQINAKEKFGVEINETAINFGQKTFSLEIKKNIDSFDDNFFDVIISNHCLEHIPDPITILKKINKKLKPGGKIVVYVPCDNYRRKYLDKDIDNHFYSFSPSNLGNCLKQANFKTITSSFTTHRWPPFYIRLKNLLGLKIFNIICHIYGFIDRSRTQTVAIAYK
jgi:SAM-dependent methyltransferase